MDAMNNKINRNEKVIKISVVACDAFSEVFIQKLKQQCNNYNDEEKEVVILIGEYENIIKVKTKYRKQMVICLPFVTTIEDSYKDCWIVASSTESEYVENIDKVFKEVNVMLNNYGEVELTFDELSKYTKGKVHFINEAINYSVSTLYFVDLEEKLDRINSNNFNDILFCTTSERYLTPYTVDKCLEVIKVKSKETTIKYYSKASEIVKDWFCITLLIKV